MDHELLHHMDQRSVVGSLKMAASDVNTLG